MKKYRRAHAVMRALRTFFRREPTVADYHDLYLFCDVLQLANVLQRLRQIAYAHYGLDPVYYYIASNFSWDSKLRNTRKVITHVISAKTVDEGLDKEWVYATTFVGKGLELELLSKKELDMYHFIKGSVRGGISQVCQRKYAKACKGNDGNYYLWILDAKISTGGP